VTSTDERLTRIETRLEKAEAAIEKAERLYAWFMAGPARKLAKLLGVSLPE
jgi:hypothetical protein